MSFITDAALYYAAEPHQDAAWEALWASLDTSTQETFTEAYRASPEPTMDNPLKVEYFSQNDNLSGTGYRECFSSSCAMMAGYYGKVKSDDEYNVIRSRYGDSTDANAQLLALNELGLAASFITTGSIEDLRAEIDAGRPVAAGWLHKGPVSNPTGGGHWSVVIGYYSDGVYMNDPNGEANLTSGGYSANLNGACLKYSYKNWLPRWEVEGKNSGWYLTCHD
jgi:uncharacterized protein YvpB